MSLEEKMQTMELLWDNLCHQEQSLESPAWHGEVLDERLAKIKQGNAEFISIDELKNRNK